MDNICHTLVGAALAQSGLKKRTGLGAATLMIGANFPDIDVIAIPLGRATEFRRGWTHGLLALVVLPFVLTMLMIAWDRYRRRQDDATRAPVLPRELLLLSTLSILTHPTLDWMNSYGMRWLMPFSGRWFYGDSLFIVDPWLLGILGLGVWLSRRREKNDAAYASHPARVATGIAVVYIASMMGLQELAERTVRDELVGSTKAREALFVVASPADPLQWRVYADDGDRYWRGTLLFTRRRGGRLAFADDFILKNANDPAAIAASNTERGRRFLDWARLPSYRIDRESNPTRVQIVDARYGAQVEILLDTQR
ncbi:MAG: metal-dependent hydrolase [Gemmatimonadaceae bacterium]